MIVPITRGMEAIIDDEDAALVLGQHWYASRGSHTWYAMHKGWKKPVVSMHRLVMGQPPKPKLVVDHIDGNGLNNSRSNLRWVPHAQNVQIGAKRSTNTSGFRGVSWCTLTKMWRVAIRRNGKKINLGRFHSIQEAAACYETALQANWCRKVESFE